VLALGSLDGFTTNVIVQRLPGGELSTNSNQRLFANATGC
jgi:hypothetical protein